MVINKDLSNEVDKLRERINIYVIMDAEYNRRQGEMLKCLDARYSPADYGMFRLKELTQELETLKAEKVALLAEVGGMTKLRQVRCRRELLLCTSTI